MKYHHRYVCEPNKIMITAESTPTNSKGIKVTFFLNNKEIYHFSHTLNTYTPTDEEIHTHVARCCSFIKDTTEDYIQDRFDEDEIMGVLNIHRSLKRVRTVPGTTIWKS